jgi:hypothetical protein
MNSNVSRKDKSGEGLAPIVVLDTVRPAGSTAGRRRSTEPPCGGGVATTPVCRAGVPRPPPARRPIAGLRVLDQASSDRSVSADTTTATAPRLAGDALAGVQHRGSHMQDTTVLPGKTINWDVAFPAQSLDDLMIEGSPRFAYDYSRGRAGRSPDRPCRGLCPTLGRVNEPRPCPPPQGRGSARRHELSERRSPARPHRTRRSGPLRTAASEVPMRQPRSAMPRSRNGSRQGRRVLNESKRDRKRNGTALRRRRREPRRKRVFSLRPRRRVRLSAAQ